ncbi:dihydroneopterin aldolase [Candidatus Peregrinibacteria bacterium]|nr:dihydroneopterin aldolase [Candidatus Peregrinibacteria bacterium]
MSVDTLTIADLELWTHIGVSEEERATEQRLLVTIEMSFDAETAARSDDVKRSINYFDVANDMRELAMKERKTIEYFAEDAAQTILKNYKTSAVTVAVKKFALPGSAHVAVTLHRENR